jgi:cobyrinic acid a,c-diamide synthase
VSAGGAIPGPIPGLIVASPSSGSGKTILTSALLRLLVTRGLRVGAAKLGPDYIDPAFHSHAAGSSCLNIDLWAMRTATVSGLLDRLNRNADIVVVEGVMGLFDGASDGRGSTADFAQHTGWPVILVVDARGQAASAGALVRGFAGHRPGVTIAGVIFNRVGGAAHGAMLRAAVEALGIPVLGLVARDDRLNLPERHLGLVQAGEHDNIQRILDGAAERCATSIDVDALLALARPMRATASPSGGCAIPPLGQRIAVASDSAFAFTYPALLEDWRSAGAEVLRFSPLADEAPADDADAVYLPGGYPELYAGRLATNAGFLDGLRKAAAQGAALFGECGGYMVLGEGLTDAEGARHAMAGLLPLHSSFASPRLHLGYRQAQVLAAGPLGDAGACYRGHEFHYASVIDEGPGDPLFDCTDARGQALGTTGRRRGAVLGSFIHLIDRGEAQPVKAR